MIDILIGWDPTTQRSKENGVFGPVEAWAKVGEELARKDLHGHTLVWVQGFNKCRRDLFSEDPEVRNALTRHSISI